ncbi:ATP-binding protein [Marinomonas atlantica]|uniref:ATP-binding protein n=1 Tax=Marinomonas atlantica TaxID=1806668 RepID=UPI0008303C1E|nr:ATP-binding protein [Marinomonas atlantica]
MRSDMWRLYRHILIGGIIISLLCYGVIEWLEHRYDEHQQEHYLLLDAELSSRLYNQSLLTIEQINERSAFFWQSKSSPRIGSNLEVSFTQNDLVEATFSDNNNILVTGVLQDSRTHAVLYILRDFLAIPSLSISEKLVILKSLSGVRLQKIAEPIWMPTFVELEAGPENSVLWQTPDVDSQWRIIVAEAETIPLNLAVLLLVILSIAALLVMVWIEFLHLDRKRAHFETVMRQIARGRGTLPQGVADSSGTLKELAYSFDSMSTHIQRLLKVQREMINAISHELRTPIARLRFGLEVLKDDVDDQLEQSISALEFDVEELNTLVDEVLTYGKLEEGTLALNFEKTSIKQILEGIVEHNQALLQKLDVKVTVIGDDTVNADTHHLHRALQNLILNASKYANSSIAITFTEDTERWQVDIEDDGPGIPAEDRDKVFIPFQRLDNSRTRASGGYGLGLAIVQRIAFWHGGAVLVEESETLGGAKFSLIWSRSQHQNSLS